MDTNPKGELARLRRRPRSRPRDPSCFRKWSDESVPLVNSPCFSTQLAPLFPAARSGRWWLPLPSTRTWIPTMVAPDGMPKTKSWISPASASPSPPVLMACWSLLAVRFAGCERRGSHSMWRPHRRVRRPGRVAALGGTCAPGAARAQNEQEHGDEGPTGCGSVRGGVSGGLSVRLAQPSPRVRQRTSDSSRPPVEQRPCPTQENGHWKSSGATVDYGP